MSKIAYAGLTLMTVVVTVIDFGSDLYLAHVPETQHAWDVAASVLVGAWSFVTFWHIMKEL